MSDAAQTDTRRWVALGLAVNQFMPRRAARAGAG